MINSVIMSQGRDYYKDDEIKILTDDELEKSLQIVLLNYICKKFVVTPICQLNNKKFRKTI